MASASSDVQMASSQGRGLSSRYRRLDENSGIGAIAKGSFGRVYVAVDTTTEETVAVKRQVLPSTSAISELCWYMALSQAWHPNVVHLLDHLVSKDVVSTCLYSTVHGLSWRGCRSEAKGFCRTAVSKCRSRSYSCVTQSSKRLSNSGFGSWRCTFARAFPLSRTWCIALPMCTSE